MKLIFKNEHIAVLEEGIRTYTVNMYDINLTEIEYVGSLEQTTSHNKSRISREWYEQYIKPVLFPEPLLRDITLSGTLLGFTFEESHFQLGFALNVMTNTEVAIKLHEFANMIAGGTK